MINVTGQITRVVRTDPVLTVTDADGPTFECGLIDPSAEGAPQGSPRLGSPYLLRYRVGPLGLPENALTAGSRVSLTRLVGDRPLDHRSFELLSPPRRVNKTGGNQLTAKLLPVDVLYPREAQLVTQRGDELQPVIDVALWTTSENHQDTGTYEEFSGEAPVELEGIKQNTALVMGTDKYRITESRRDLIGPRIVFRARRSNG